MWNDDRDLKISDLQRRVGELEEQNRVYVTEWSLCRSRSFPYVSLKAVVMKLMELNGLEVQHQSEKTEVVQKPKPKKGR